MATPMRRTAVFDRVVEATANVKPSRRQRSVYDTPRWMLMFCLGCWMWVVGTCVAFIALIGGTWPMQLLFGSAIAFAALGFCCVLYDLLSWTHLASVERRARR